MVNDTSIDYTASLKYWLVPLLSNPNFNDNRTLIVLSFNEDESYKQPDSDGAAVPKSARNTDDLTTYYTYYSTIQANWGLKSLGRGNTSNVP